jgi:hypothetical protein
MLKSRWVGANNSYRRDTVTVLRQEFQGGGPPNSKQLGEYIAASVLLHAADGWTLLGKALDSHGKGDSETALHLGYYAELRAAMSLLACEGIGVFNDRHVVVDASGVAHWLNFALRRRIGTHVMTWLALEAWADSSKCSELMADTIMPGGRLLREWLQALQPGTAWWPIGSAWLKAWGLDLQVFGQDRDARNVVSYRPTRLDPDLGLGVSRATDFYSDFWRLCEPVTSQPFGRLDRYLVRRMIEAAHRALPPLSGKARREASRRIVKRTLTNLGFGDRDLKMWIDFILRDVDPRDPIIAEAGKKARLGARGQHVQVMSRATLLLRVATGAVLRMLREGGVDQTMIEFWSRGLGEAHGFWKPGSPPQSYVDLWADVDVAVQELQTWHVVQNPATICYADLRAAQGSNLAMLGESERVLFWSLAS